MESGDTLHQLQDEVAQIAQLDTLVGRFHQGHAATAPHPPSPPNPALGIPISNTDKYDGNADNFHASLIMCSLYLNNIQDNIHQKNRIYNKM